MAAHVLEKNKLLLLMLHLPFSACYKISWLDQKVNNLEAKIAIKTQVTHVVAYLGENAQKTNMKITLTICKGERNL